MTVRTPPTVPYVHRRRKPGSPWPWYAYLPRGCGSPQCPGRCGASQCFRVCISLRAAGAPVCWLPDRGHPAWADALEAVSAWYTRTGGAP